MEGKFIWGANENFEKIRQLSNACYTEFMSSFILEIS